MQSEVNVLATFPQGPTFLQMGQCQKRAPVAGLPLANFTNDFATEKSVFFVAIS
jgi:hypothetical protein